VVTFGIATNREWVDASGQKQEGAEYHKIVAWNKLAEICANVLFKGRKCFVSGRLQTRTWQGQDGAERQTTEIVIDEMIAFGEGRGNGSEETSYSSGSTDTVTSDASEVFAEEVPTGAKKSAKKSKAQEIADDIPF
jgi:single-strand DNA-binding protein